MLSELKSAPDPKEVRLFLEGLSSDGYWPDVNYDDDSTARWKPAEHLRRLRILTQAWYAPRSPRYADTDLAETISLALDSWLHRDPRRWWWWDCIGAPALLSPTMLMLDRNLSPFQLEKGTEILNRAKLSDSPGKSETGQNLVWQAEINASRAVLDRDNDRLARAFKRLASVITLNTEEGIQHDFSFHQHDHCLYNHGYGAGFAVDNARLAAIAAGTVYAYPKEKIEILSRYILDGSQWLAHGGQSDFGAEGREIAKPDQDAQYLALAAKHMLQISTGREEEFRNLAARVTGQSAPPLLGNRHFFRSDIMVHHRADWYMSARMYSTRMFNTDNLAKCDEGLLSHYVAEGATCIMRHGKEYHNLFPVWDWQRVPGTTVELSPHEPGEPRRIGETSFAGGVSDGVHGAAGFDLKRDALRARKAWFFFSDIVVCLGSGIHCESEHEINTTLNQCRLNGPVTVGEKASSVLAPGAHHVSSRWIHHDGIGYLFPDVQSLRISNQQQTGSWHRVSSQRPDIPITEPVFSMSIEHGPHPDGDAYAYAVVPGIEAQNMTALASRQDTRILANRPDVQAVFHASDATLGALFYRSGRFELSDWTLEVDRACALLCTGTKDAWTVSVADPAAGEGPLRVAIQPPGEQSVTMTVKLPVGSAAGASVRLPLQ